VSRLSEKVAIVTGASKGIGAGVATALGVAGARVPWLRSFLRLFLNPRFQPTIRMSLTTSQVLRRPPEVT